MVFSLLGLAVATTLSFFSSGVGAPVAQADALDLSGPDARTVGALDDDGCFTVTDFSNIVGYKWGFPIFGRLPQVTIKDGTADPTRVATGEPVKITITAQNRASEATVALRATVRYPNGQTHSLNRGNFTLGLGTFAIQNTEPWDLTVQVPSVLGTYYIDAEVMSNDQNANDRSSCAGTKKVNVASFEVVTNTAPTATKESPDDYFVDVNQGDSKTFRVSGTDAERNLNTWRWLVAGSEERLQSVTPTDESEDSFSYKFDDPGNHIVTVVSKDTKNRQSFGVSWQVDVSKATPTIDSLGCKESTVSLSETVTCRPSISDGNPTSYGWEVDGGVTRNSGDRNLSVYWTSTGPKTVSLTASNNSGKSEPETFRVRVVNEEPSVSRISISPSPSAGNLLKSGTNYSFSATGTDDDGNLSACEWYIGTSLQDSSQCDSFGSWTGSKTAAMTFNEDSPGPYTVRVVFRDSGGESDEDSRTVTVNSPPEVTLVSPTSRSLSIYEGQELNFTVRAEDADGNLMAWKVDKVGSLDTTSIVEEESVGEPRNTTKLFDHLFDSDGTWDIRPAFTDALSGRIFDSWTVTVQSPPDLAVELVDYDFLTTGVATTAVARFDVQNEGKSSSGAYEIDFYIADSRGGSDHHIGSWQDGANLEVGEELLGKLWTSNIFRELQGSRWLCGQINYKTEVIDAVQENNTSCIEAYVVPDMSGDLDETIEPVLFQNPARVSMTTSQGTFDAFMPEMDDIAALDIFRAFQQGTDHLSTAEKFDLIQQRAPLAATGLLGLLPVEGTYESLEELKENLTDIYPYGPDSHYWIFVPTDLISVDVAEGINDRAVGGLDVSSNRKDLYVSLILDLVIRDEVWDKISAEELLVGVDFEEGEVFAKHGIEEIDGSKWREFLESFDEYEEKILRGASVSADIVKYYKATKELIDIYRGLGIDRSLKVGYFTYLSLALDGIKFGEQWADVAAAAGAYRAINIQDAYQTLELLETLTVSPQEDWARAIRDAREQLDLMTSEDAWDRFSAAIEENQDQLLAAYVDLGVSVAITGAVIAAPVFGVPALAVVAAGAAIKFTIDVVRHIDSFWDNISLATGTAQVYVSLQNLNDDNLLESGIPEPLSHHREILEYSKFRFYDYLSYAEDNWVSEWTGFINLEDKLHDNADYISEMRGTALGAAIAATRVATLEFKETSITLNAGEGRRLEPVFKSGSGKTLGSHIVRWSSSDEKIAKVTRFGEITGIADGLATIKAELYLGFEEGTDLLESAYIAENCPSDPDPFDPAWQQGTITPCHPQWRGIVSGPLIPVIQTAEIAVTVTKDPLADTCSNGIAVSDPGNNPGLVEDCEVLIQMRDSLAGTETLDWSTSRSISSWQGISFHADVHRVAGVKLEDLGLDGTLPSTISGPTQIMFIHLSGNELTGSIPAALGSLSQLRILDLSENRLSGSIPATLTFANWSNLEEFKLNNNGLTGTIPTGIRYLSALRILDLSHNGLRGAIPRYLSELDNLLTLNLRDNSLSSPIPGQLGELPVLQILDLRNNDLTGRLPGNLDDLGRHLREIYLSGNSGLSGCVTDRLWQVPVNDYAAAELEQCSNVPVPVAVTWASGILSLSAATLDAAGGDVIASVVTVDGDQQASAPTFTITGPVVGGVTSKTGTACTAGRGAVLNDGEQCWEASFTLPANTEATVRSHNVTVRSRQISSVPVGRVTVAAAETTTTEETTTEEPGPTSAVTATVIAALAPLGVNLQWVLHFDNETQEWLYYNAGAPPTGTLDQLAPGQVYWLGLDEDQAVALGGVTRVLKAGVNQVVW